jgi:cellulose synthase/poly-beta-1,6-N-acetylglucosamine synthase-like glycosyltransferase
MNILNVLEIGAATYFHGFGAYLATCAVAGRLRNLPEGISTNDQYKISVLLPAYKEDAVIVDSAKHALNQSYNRSMYEVCVIADSLKQETLTELRALPIRVCEVHFEKSTKAKALNEALRTADADTDIAVILDADNLMSPDFLRRIAWGFERGYKAVQGRRVAKNMNTNFAILDAASESINNHIFRKGYNSLGLSSSIIGSGVAFDFNILKELMAQNKAIGGFDRVLQLQLLERGHKIWYFKQAEVQDEKVDNPEVFQNQRKRWLSSQFKNLRQYFKLGIKHLFLGNFSYANLVLSNTMLPRVMLLGGIVSLTGLAVLFPQYSILGPAGWLAGLGLYVVAFTVSLGKFAYDKRLLTAAASLPKAFLKMTGLLFKLKNADKTFIHTPHVHKG